jgi:hypothetical protein
VTHPRNTRASALTVALIPSVTLVVVGLALGGMLVRQGARARDFAGNTSAAITSATRLVADVQEERRRVDIGHPEVGSAHDKLVDNAVANLQRTAADAPDAQVGYQQIAAAQLLATVDGLSRTDALAAAGTEFTAEQWSSFVSAFGSYHANLAAVAPKLQARGRELYLDLMRSEPWIRLSAVENALVDGERSPAAQADWRACARQVADKLAALSAQQSSYAVQVAESSGSRTMAGALAGGAAIVILAVLAFCLAIRLSRRLDKENTDARVALRPRHRAGRLARSLSVAD